jgi:hypothetical protein
MASEYQRPYTLSEAARLLRSPTAPAWPGERSPDLALLKHWINPNHESALLGNVSLRVRRLIVPTCNVTRTRYGVFVHLPSTPMVDGDGNVLKDENGKWQDNPPVRRSTKTPPVPFQTRSLS